MYIKVRVHADSGKELLEKVSESHFNIWVREKAKQNEANKKIIEILNNYFKHPAGGIRIINGHHSPSKLIAVGDD